TSTGQVVDTIHVGDAPSLIALAGDAIWVLDRVDSTLSQIDSNTDAVVRTASIGGGPAALVTDRSDVWISNGNSRLLHLDHGVQVGGPQVGGKTGALVLDRDGLWVASRPGGARHRGGTLRLVSAGFGSPMMTDPALGWNLSPTEFHGLAYD